MTTFKVGDFVRVKERQAEEFRRAGGDSPMCGRVISVGGQSLVWVRDVTGGEWGLPAEELEHIEREETMSENRFAYCQTVQQVLRAVLPIGPNPELWDGLESDALARIRELTPPPPTVSEEARERAQEVLDKGVRNLPISGRNVYLRGLLVRIIDALGYTPAPTVTPQGHKPYHCTACYTTGHSQTTRTRCASCDGAWNVNWSKDHDAWFCGYCWKREVTASPTVVDLDTDALRSLTALVDAHQQCAIEIGPMAMTISGVRLVIDDVPDLGMSVLRIGGTDE